MHGLTYSVTNYPGSQYAHVIRWSCGCGLRGMLTDGRVAPTISAAKAAHDRKAARELVSMEGKK